MTGTIFSAINDGAAALLKLFLHLNLSATFSETITHLSILCTIAMTTAESERSLNKKLSSKHYGTR